jgi:hypothetical protein
VHFAAQTEKLTCTIRVKGLLGSRPHVSRLILCANAIVPSRAIKFSWLEMTASRAQTSSELCISPMKMWHNYSRIATRGPGVSLLLRMPSDLPTPTFYPELPEDGSEASTGNVGVYLCASSFHTYELGQKRPSKLPRDWIGKKPKPGPLESVRCSHALKIKKRKKSWLDVTAIASATVPPLGRPTKALHPSRQQTRVVT